MRAKEEKLDSTGQVHQLGLVDIVDLMSFCFCFFVFGDLSVICMPINSCRKWRKLECGPKTVILSWKSFAEEE